MRVRRGQAQRNGVGKRFDRALPSASRTIQGTEESRVRRVAENVDRQDSEVRAAGAREVLERDRMNDSAKTDPLRVLRDDADGIATLTLNRPAQYNAIDSAMLDEL